MAIAAAIHKISDLINKICCILSIIMLTSMVIITGVQIICRVFFTALSWSEELTRYLLVWSTFIGGSIVYKYSGHISITMLQEKCPPNIQKLLEILVHVICAGFCLIAVFYGFKYMSMQGTQLSAALRIPMKYMYMAIPVGSSVMVFHALDAIITRLVGKKEQEVREV